MAQLERDRLIGLAEAPEIEAGHDASLPVGRVARQWRNRFL
jgi:hypothetical protein